MSTAVAAFCSHGVPADCYCRFCITGVEPVAPSEPNAAEHAARVDAIRAGWDKDAAALKVTATVATARAAGLEPHISAFPARTPPKRRGGLPGTVWSYTRNGQQYDVYEAAPTVAMLVAHADAVDAERRVNPRAYGGAA